MREPANTTEIVISPSNPSRRRNLGLLAGVAIVLPSALLAAPKKRPAVVRKKERVVLQISESDPKRWNMVMNVAKNLQEHYGEDKVEVAVVALGPGVNMLKEDSDVGNRVQTAIERKVFFMACGSSMKSLNVDVNSLGRHIFVVPSGAAELVQRQRDGWAYLRP